MKFEHHLYEENVPEWRKAYINYKQGKSYLKAIRHAVEKLETVQQQAEKPVDDHDQAEDDETRALTLSMGYARASENTLAQYTTTDSESEEPIIQGRDQSKTYDAISASTKTKRPYSTALTIDEDRSERGSLLRDHLDGSDVDGLPKFTRPQRRPSSAVQVGEAALAQVQGNSLDSVMETLLDEEKVFFKFLDSQLEMVDNFYREKETEAVMKLKILKQQLYVADEWKRRYDERIAQAEATGGWYSAEWSRVRNELGSLVVGAPDITSVTLGALPEPLSDAEQTISPSGFKPSAKAGREAIIDMSAESGLRPRQSRKPEEEIQQGSPLTGPMEESNQMLLDNEKDQRMMFLHHKVARSRIKVALYEFYRGLEMTKNYKILNETGFTKIMKKFDKTAGWKASQAFKASKLQLRYFMCSSTLDELIKETETLYVDKFEDGNRHRGMSKLRIPDQKNKVSIVYGEGYTVVV
ncbi:hypothetical protein BGX28_009871 [Mortierella sp. GBA30]|nr:hypothetical protein BGX28_009871 [Mortierella sp. GBA30]